MAISLFLFIPFFSLLWCWFLVEKYLFICTAPNRIRKNQFELKRQSISRWAKHKNGKNQHHDDDDEIENTPERWKIYEPKAKIVCRNKIGRERGKESEKQNHNIRDLHSYSRLRTHKKSYA